MEEATRRHVDSRHYAEDGDGVDFLSGYGYQFWRSRHGFHGNGAFGQHCVVVPSHDLVVAVTGAQQEVRHAQDVLDAMWDCLLPGVGRPDGPDDDALLAERLRRLALPLVAGAAGPGRPVTARLDASVEGSALPEGITVVVEPADGGWVVRLGPRLAVEVGHGERRESAPLGRPVVASGAWQGATFVADLFVIRSPHRVRLVVDGGTATATWSTQPLTSADLEVHLRSPLMTRPDVA